jgi:uncharacterized repeat protein (TIGR01451 family)
VTDVFPSALVDPEWSCVAGDGAECGDDEGTASIDQLVELPPGASVVYTATGTVSQSATGTLTNTAAVAATLADTDPDLTNNQATDVDEIVSVADLMIEKSNGVDVVFQGDEVTYLVTVTNNGPSDAPQTGVSDVFPDELLDTQWSCTAGEGADCGSGGELRLIDDMVLLPANVSIVYTVVGTVDTAADGDLVNTATVSSSPDVEEANTSNNEATDSDPILTPAMFEDEFESGDTSAWDLESSTTHIVDLDDEGPEPWLATEVADGLTRVRVRFRLDLTDTTMDDGTQHVIVAGDDGVDPQPVFLIELGRQAGEFQLRAGVEDDALTMHETTWSDIGSGVTWVELLWWSSADPDEVDGGVELWVDGQSAGLVDALTNGNRQVTQVAVGALDGVDEPSSGTHRFENWRWSRGSTLPGEPWGAKRGERQ